MESRTSGWDVRGGLIVIIVMMVSACSHGSSVRPQATTMAVDEMAELSGRRVILDFEQSNPAVEWNVDAGTARGNSAPPSTQKGGEGEGVLGRSALRPEGGLWSLKVALRGGESGRVVHKLSKAMDLRGFDTLTAAVMHAGASGRNGEYVARLFVVDEEGNRVWGDALPVTSKWQELMLDLKGVTGAGEAMDWGRVAEVGVELRKGREAESGSEGIEIQTDTWAATRDFRAYLGERRGTAKNFYVEREGTELHVGMARHYEVTFYNRSGTKRPWMAITQGAAGIGGNGVLGSEGTGLMLLDQGRYDGFGGAVRQDADDGSRSGAGGAETMNAGQAPPLTAGWPVAVGEEGKVSEETRWRWECVWTSPVAAIVEVKQEVGPYDRLGEAAARVTWRFMIYQWGQIFVHAQWSARSGAGLGNPMTWALVQNDWPAEKEGTGIQASSPADADRLLNAVYPVSVHDGLETALPHQMQRGAPVAMIAKSGGGREKNLWWWARVGGKRIFGVGLGGAREQGSCDCMLLVNSPTALSQAGSFSQYLVPPKVKVREGELDRNFPGDMDNDGLVDSYGFQVVRLAGGRATFMVYPQERPLFYPPYLFTVPAVEREAVNLRNSRLLINIDGKQFADPPQFPDGSFLLQLPYVIDRPVQVEAVLVKR